MYWYGPHLGGWGWAAGLGSLLFWVIFAVAAAVLIRSFLRGGRPPYPPDQGYRTPPGHGPVTPEQILAERFARGEIDEDEFWRRMTTLRASRQGDVPPGPAS
jgi:putative membrane protein